jgi:predicted CoA-binding protein
VPEAGGGLVGELQSMGFEINPYNPCVANKMVNGSQMTIRWHVDDLMISHLKQEEIMQVVQQIKDIYGKKLKENVGTPTML